MNPATDIVIAIGVCWLAVAAGKLTRIAVALERVASESSAPAQWPTCDETLNGQPGDPPCTRPMGHGGGCAFP